MKDFDIQSKRFCSVFGVDDALMVSAGAGAAGNIFSSIFGNSAAKQQASAIRYAADKASETALTMNQRSRDDLAPFRQMGTDAGGSLMDLMMGKKDMSDFLKSSGLFQYESELGSRNMNRELKARGLYGSGAGLESLARFNNQLVAEEGQRTYDRLFGMTQLGQNAAAGMANTTNQTGQTVANIQANAGMAAAQATGDATRSLGQIGQGLSGPLQSGISSYMSYQLNKPILDAYAKQMSGRSLSAMGGPMVIAAPGSQSIETGWN